MMDWSQYEPVMYDSSEVTELTPGQVVQLDKAFTEKFVRHDSAKPIFRDFFAHPKYSHGLFVILNKACDLVHEEGQEFDSDVFLAPTITLKEALNSRRLAGYLKRSRSLSESLVSAFKQFSRKTFVDEKAKAGEEKGTARTHFDSTEWPLLEEIVRALFANVDKIPATEGLLVSVQQSLIKFADDNNELKERFEKFNESKELRTCVKEYLEVAVPDDTFIIEGEEKFRKLIKNQTDELGLFTYEPHEKIFSTTGDLCLVLDFRECFSVKIGKAFMATGEIVTELKRRTTVKLNDSYSARVQNLLSSFYAKVGTSDVDVSKVHALYKQAMPDHYFESTEEFKVRKKGQPSDKV